MNKENQWVEQLFTDEIYTNHTAMALAFGATIGALRGLVDAVENGKPEQKLELARDVLEAHDKAQGQAL